MPQENKRRTEETEHRDANRDPITGAPGSHPVGTGIGAAAGGAAGAAGGVAAGAAVGTAGAGPIGGVVGAAAGAVLGGLAGKGVAESVNPTEEDAYWREHYNREPYYNRNYTYDDYQGAYRTGYEGYARHANTGSRYDDVETELQRDYERNYGSSRLDWEHARPAVRAAWQKFDRNLDRYIGYDVVDRNGNSIGTLECLWADHRGEPAFVGVRTGWFIGKTHVVPANSVEVSERGHRLRLPYSIDKVKNAPAYDADSEMTEEKEREVYRYYGLDSRTGTEATGATSGEAPMAATGVPTGATSETRPGSTATPPVLESHREDQSREGATLKLAEEQLRVEKRQVEAGGVRLRKIVRTETVNQPVELQREEIVIERVPAGEAQGQASFGEQQEIYIPLRREEAVVEKETRVREEVRARKESQTDTEHVSGEVRREDVEVEHTGEAREAREGPGRGRTKR